MYSVSVFQLAQTSGRRGIRQDLCTKRCSY